FVPDAVNGQQVARFGAIIPKLFAQLHDHLVKSSRRPIVIITPYFTQQTVPGQNFTWMRMEQLQQFQFLCREFFGDFSTGRFEGLGVDRHQANFKASFGIYLAWASSPPEQRMDSGQELANSKWLGHIIISAKV